MSRTTTVLYAVVADGGQQGAVADALLAPADAVTWFATPRAAKLAARGGEVMGGGRWMPAAR